MQLRRHRDSQGEIKGPKGSRLWGMGLALGAAMSCTVSTSSLPASYELASYGMLLLAGLVGAALACLGSIAWRATGRGAASSGAAGPAVGCLLVLAALTLMRILPAGGATLAPAASWACGLMLGAGFAALMVQWGCRYSAADECGLASVTAASFLVGALVLAAAFAMPRGTAAAAFVAAATLASACLLGRRRAPATSATSEGDPGVTGHQDGLAASDGPRVASARRTLRPLWGQLWRPLLLALIVCWVFGLIWDTPVDFAAGTGLVPYDLSLVTGLLLACALFLVMTRVGGDGVFSSAACTVALPLVAAALLLLPTVAGDALVPASFAMNALSWACFSLLAMLLWMQLATARRDAGAQMRGGAFALAGASCCAMAALGLALAPLLGPSGQAVTLVLFVGYFVASAIVAQTPQVSAIDDGASAHDYDARCAQVCREHGLSAREGEVLAYLGRGYPQSFVASELGISESTVHTHARKIYNKLGVSSKGELITLMTVPCQTDCETRVAQPSPENRRR